MAIKPLPLKLQKTGRRISMVLSLVIGAVFLASVSSFIALTASMKSDQYVASEASAPLALKDVEDGFIYSTNDKQLVYVDYNKELIEKYDIATLINDTYSMPKLTAISSLSYASNTDHLFLTGSFYDSQSQVTNEYLFRMSKNDGHFVFDQSVGYSKVTKSISCFIEANNQLFAIIRDGKYCTLNRFDSNDLKSGPIETAYLFRKIINFDESEQAESSFYTALVNAVVHSMYFNASNDTVYCVADTGVIGIKVGSFDSYKLSLNEKTENINHSQPSDFAKYIFYSYSSNNTNPHGAVVIGNECYMITDAKSMAHFSFLDLDSSIPSDEESPEVFEKTLADIIFTDSAPTNRNGLFYNPESKIGVVISELSDSITYLNMHDLSNITIEFIDVADINITDVVINPDGTLIYYLCLNEEVSESKDYMLKVKNYNDVMENIKIGKFTPTLFVFSIVALLFFVLALLCWVKPMFLEQFLAFIKNFKQNWVAYVILIGCLTLLGMFCYYPAVGSISMSFFRYENNKPIVWNNFGNYVKIFTDVEIWKSFGNMLIFLVTDIITAIIPPLIFAFFLTVMKSKRMSAVARTLLFLPSVIPGITKMMIWQNGIYGEHGVINLFIDLFKGNPVQFFNGSNFDIGWLILMGFPYVGSYLVFYGALMNIPSSYYEAAELEGLNIWKRFIKIDIPLIQPQIKYVVILTIIASVQNFGRTYMINSSLFTVRTPIHIMYEYINVGNYGLSSAIAAILFILLLFATIFNMRKQKAQLGDSI